MREGDHSSLMKAWAESKSEWDPESACQRGAGSIIELLCDCIAFSRYGQFHGTGQRSSPMAFIWSVVWLNMHPEAGRECYPYLSNTTNDQEHAEGALLSLVVHLATQYIYRSLCELWANIAKVVAETAQGFRFFQASSMASCCTYANKCTTTSHGSTSRYQRQTRWRESGYQWTRILR